MSDELSSLKVSRREGYTDIKIQGAKLSMSTDFKTWLGIILAFSTYGYSNETIRLHDSLFSISSATLSSSSKDGKNPMFSHLLQRAVLNMNTDTVEITADNNLWKLYY
ncbi:hypothetical protein ACCY16_20200 [Candidatus Pantoea formicae]|uniref:hypothetical protein n=1 Tax=Candidatus Pantoea formicae TaxID=2608355 RepID=UPI003ED9FE48